MKRNKFLMNEEENLKTSLPMGFVQLHLLSKQNYLAPSVEIYSYLAESGYATSVTPAPEDFGNGWNGGGGDLGGGDPEDPTNPFSDPTDPLNPISF